MVSSVESLIFSADDYIDALIIVPGINGLGRVIFHMPESLLQSAFALL